MNTPGIRYTGARRGIFGLHSWEPVNLPQQFVSAAPASSSSLSHSDKQSVNAASSVVSHSEQPAVHQQRPRAQSTELPTALAEHVTSNTGDISKKASSIPVSRELSFDVVTFVHQDCCIVAVWQYLRAG